MSTTKKMPMAAKPAKTPAAGLPVARIATPAPAANNPASKAATKAATQAAKAAAPLPDKAATRPASEKIAKARKPKLVRDSFTIPKAEYTVLEDLKQRAGRLSSPVKKSELLRAGIKALAAMPQAAFLAALQAVPAIKTGRPANT